MKELLKGNYIRLQIDLAIGSDDMDDATEGNIENLKSEAQRLLVTHKEKINKICEIL